MAWLEARHGVESCVDVGDDPQAIRKLIYRAEGLVLPRKTVVTRDFLDFAPRLKAIARLHGGTDNTDLEACRERGVRVIHASTANVRANAEYLLGALLMLYRRGIVSTLAGDRHAEPRLGRELYGSTVGLLGLAPTAHTLAGLLTAMGVRVVGYDPAIHHTAPIWRQLRVQPLPLTDMLAQADAVSVQVIYASRFKGFIGEKLLEHCKPGQLWVGISRSSLFDPQALADALGDGRISAAVLDGAEAGFASRGSPLHDCENLFLTPRLGSHTRESRQRASWYVVHRMHETLSAPRPSGYQSDFAPSASFDVSGEIGSALQSVR